MKPILQSPQVAIYELSSSGPRVLVASTEESRAICNDPLIFGVRYTRMLTAACTKVLRALTLPLSERETSVVHLLRGGLNFGLREALADAYGWNAHGASFLSAQRRRKADDPEQWEISEAEYRKLAVGPRVSLVLGDVVASGASLEHGLSTMLDGLKEQGSRLRSIVFFTVGGPRTEEVFQAIEPGLRARYPEYEGTTVIYLEGRFPVAHCETPLSIKVSGTDLLRHGDAMAPEFVASQYECPMFPVERCTIYDAGSRAFEPRAYLDDVLEYWQEVQSFHGRCFTDYLAERCPVLEPARFSVSSLSELADEQVRKLKAAQ